MMTADDLVGTGCDDGFVERSHVEGAVQDVLRATQVYTWLVRNPQGGKRTPIPSSFPPHPSPLIPPTISLYSAPLPTSPHHSLTSPLPLPRRHPGR